MRWPSMWHGEWVIRDCEALIKKNHGENQYRQRSVQLKVANLRLAAEEQASTLFPRLTLVAFVLARQIKMSIRCATSVISRREPEKKS